MLPGISFTVLIHALSSVVEAYDTWCGKHYEALAPRVPPSPNSYFSYPPRSNTPLLYFSCVTASSIYLVGDEVLDPPALIFDANLTRDIGQSYDGGQGDELEIRVYHETTLVLSTSLTLPSTGHIVPLPLDTFDPSLAARELRCIATKGDQTYEHSTELFYLPPNPWGGSSVKLDRRIGGLRMLKESGWEDSFPFGFYDSINVKEVKKEEGSGWFQSDQLPIQTDNFGQKSTITNRDRLNWATKLGFNIIHPVPPSTSYAPDGDDTAIQAYFKEAERLNIGILYDMRHGFTRLDLVEAQVQEFRSKRSLAVWYTSDEPDGPGLPLVGTSTAKDLIRHLDPYHPVAIVLNCYDHHFRSYASGTDILLVDVYSIAMNPIWSKKWNTEITPTFGCSGCDGCKGNFYDLPDRIDEWRSRIRVMGRERTMPIWVVPQAFDDHGDEFWWRIPSGDEVAIQTLLAVNHGATGHCAWIASGASEDILRNASALAQTLYATTDFIISNAHTRRLHWTTYPLDPNGRNGLDVASWTRVHKGRKETLVFAVQMYYTPRESAQDGRTEFHMGRLSVAAVVLEQVDDEPELGLLDKVLAGGLRVGLGSEL